MHDIQQVFYNRTFSSSSVEVNATVDLYPNRATNVLALCMSGNEQRQEECDRLILECGKEKNFSNVNSKRVMR